MRKFLLLLFFIACLFVHLQAKMNDQIGKKAPDFKLKSLTNNSQVSLSSFRGKVVLVDFWASWCAPCKLSMPKLEKLARKYKDFTVIAVNIDDDKANALKFLNEQRLDVNAVHDSSKKVVSKYNVPEMPTAYLIDQYGKIQFIHSGYSEEKLKKLEFAIRSLVD